MNSSPSGSSPVPPAVLAAIDVFRVHADTLCFPGVDYSTLEALLEQVRHSHQEVERCEQALADAQHALQAQQTILHDRTNQGLAYARIYAHDTPELLESLNAIDLEPKRSSVKRGGKRASSRTRRPKPIRKDESVTELPFVGEPAEPQSHAGVA